MHTSGETTDREQIDTNLMPADWVDLYHCHYCAPQADQGWWPIPHPSLTFAGRLAFPAKNEPLTLPCHGAFKWEAKKRVKLVVVSRVSCQSESDPHATPIPSRRSRQHPLNPLDSRKPSPTTNTNKGHAQQVNIGLLFTAESLYCCRSCCTAEVLGNKCFSFSLTTIATDGFPYLFALIAAW